MGFFDFDSEERVPHPSFAQFLFAKEGGDFDPAANLSANCLNKIFEQRQLYSAILRNVCA